MVRPRSELGARAGRAERDADRVGGVAGAGGEHVRGPINRSRAWACSTSSRARRCGGIVQPQEVRRRVRPILPAAEPVGGEPADARSPRRAGRRGVAVAVPSAIHCAATSASSGRARPQGRRGRGLERAPGGCGSARRKSTRSSGDGGLRRLVMLPGALGRELGQRRRRSGDQGARRGVLRRSSRRTRGRRRRAPVGAPSASPWWSGYGASACSTELWRRCRTGPRERVGLRGRARPARPGCVGRRSHPAAARAPG